MSTQEFKVKLPEYTIEQIERIIYNKNTTIEEYVVSVILEKADQDFRRIVKPFSFYW
ncbi:hypothetical protein MDR98_003578 [Escherichia coli]|uniref:Uncharacterized protein n=2 Tax=Escherichia coli TaxID=562 RepID=A0A376HHH5_ECOLX|nr:MULTISPECIES: hypothetical protein [Enterobacteriaceae]EHU14830.1 hypothetical protein ECDEC1B_1827 [Escherichia coli DEC1B]EHU30110.1 hypothetical protein ECDEC2A_1964 [Escherichia coli DEC2A]EHU45887.1 hypothetical protein ECDEC2C_1739 [Escherichia coli DEC2C]MCZ8601423.1 hypothetical protein [Escherichia albertii]EHK5574109.1 hypothetical protein [Escherichia coli]